MSERIIAFRSGGTEAGPWAAARSDDRQAFALAVEDCERTLYRVSRTVLRRDEDCADAVQEALCKAWRNLPGLREPSYFRTWLIRILLNECYKLQRQRGRTVPLDDAAADRPGVGIFCDELIDLKRALDALPEKQRVVAALYYAEDFKVGEIASILRVPAGTVKSRLAKARKKLAACLATKEGL